MAYLVDFTTLLIYFLPLRFGSLFCGSIFVFSLRHWFWLIKLWSILELTLNFVTEFDSLFGRMSLHLLIFTDFVEYVNILCLLIFTDSGCLFFVECLPTLCTFLALILEACSKKNSRGRVTFAASLLTKKQVNTHYDIHKCSLASESQQKQVWRETTTIFSNCAVRFYLPCLAVISFVRMEGLSQDRPLPGPVTYSMSKFNHVYWLMNFTVW